MDLVIHDLDEKEWGRISKNYDGWNVVSGSGDVRPCIGCFCCWNKDPGKCVIKDGYEDMGYLIHHAGEVVVISRYTYGGFSGSVKGVFDRCLGYVLPQFEVINGETHHMRRYDEDKPFTFIFYGNDLTDEEKESARRYVNAVCANIRGHVKEVIFRQCGEVTELRSGSPEAGLSHFPEEENLKPDKTVSYGGIPEGRVVLLNGSMRNVTGNSAKLARQLARMMTKKSVIIDLKDHINDMTPLISTLGSAETIVLCVPLYVDGLPARVIRMMEEFRDKYSGGAKKIYVLANMGLYESSQLVNLFYAVRSWCGKMGLEYCGGLGVSAGELLGTLMGVIPSRIGPNKKVFGGMKKLASAVDSGEKTEDIYAEPHHFPRSLYIRIANANWNRTAKKNGIRPEDLYRRL